MVLAESRREAAQAKEEARGPECARERRWKLCKPGGPGSREQSQIRRRDSTGNSDIRSCRAVCRCQSLEKSSQEERVLADSFCQSWWGAWALAGAEGRLGARREQGPRKGRQGAAPFPEPRREGQQDYNTVTVP